VTAALRTFLRFPSVSNQPQHAADVAACAAWLADHLRRVGLPFVRVVRTRRHPIVYAEWCRAPARPTVLVYGHYDVVPPDPVDQWQSPPFTPTVRAGHIYARGASDDKGQLFAHVTAIANELRRTGRLPVNVKLLFEGEEEIGSPNLHPFVRKHRRRLAADAVVISDTQMRGPDQPAIITGLRGGLALEVTVRGPPRELHSGQFGGAIHNPVQVLAELLAKFHTPAGRIAVPGLYDDVREVPEQRGGRTDGEILAAAGVSRGWGEAGFTPHERTTVRPAVTFTGVVGGWTGPGNQSIIPATATAKIAFRLVPDQTPDAVERLVRRFLARHTPPTVRLTARRLSAALPVSLDRTHPAFAAAADALRVGFGRRPVFVRSGGSIPVVHTLLTELGVPPVLMGFGLPADGAHAPNERFALARFRRAVRTATAFLYLAATCGNEDRPRSGRRHWLTD
jgi:acetylornithine deacetylase/succinyl-diaminopimelate desuccinylase-like protein